MMTEDDTFNALKRTPFIRLFIMCINHGVQIGDDIIYENLPLILANGWGEEEFRQKVILEAHLDNISMDISLVNDSEWRSNLLRCDGR